MLFSDHTHSIDPNKNVVKHVGFCIHLLHSVFHACTGKAFCPFRPQEQNGTLIFIRFEHVYTVEADRYVYLNTEIYHMQLFYNRGHPIQSGFYCCETSL